MRRWTVMLIPHDRSQTRNLEMASYQLALVVIVLVALSFSTAFLFKRQQVMAGEAARLGQLVQELRVEQTRQQTVAAEPAPSGLSEAQRAEIEQRVRAEYEASVAAITAQLNELYEIETEARELTGFAPRTPAKAPSTKDMGSGKGGGPSSLSDQPLPRGAVMALPPNVIYGLSRPSADLILQEINVRTASLKGLVKDLYAQRDRVHRTPSVWPVASAQHKITSRFGYRKDPFTNRVRHHDGTDIVAPYGSPIVATANGVVVEAGWDGYLGNMVRIDHGNGLETVYAHLKQCLVKKGDVVERFDKIGALGNTGRTTGAHLHYEVHLNGEVVDSGKYLRE